MSRLTMGEVARRFLVVLVGGQEGVVDAYTE